MSKSYIEYKDIAPMAEYDASVSATGASPLSNVSKLPHGADPGKVITGELNQWVLDGEHTTTGEKVFAFWSEELSGADCLFENNPVIDIQFTQQHASLGLTLVFDETDGNYCTDVNIKWYRDGAVEVDKNFSPDSTRFFAREQVTAYDRIVITLKKTSLPVRMAKVNHIIFGVYRKFDMSNLRNVTIINQTDILSAEFPVSTMDIVLESHDDLGFMFQLKQPMEAWNNENLIGVYYIDEHTRSSTSLYSIGCYDSVGVLDESPFPGGVYNGASAIGILQAVVHPYFSIDTEGVTDVQVTGIIPPGTRREAIQQVLFAAGWVAATDGGSTIRVFSLDNTLKTIGQNRTYFGAKASISSIVTEVRVTAHTYTQDSNGSIEIGGQKYKDTETVYTVTNPDVTANDKQNVIEVTNGTLISTVNGQATAQRVYDYYLMRQTDGAKIVWSEERLGEYVSLPTNWGTIHSGYIEKMTIKLSNTVAVQLETRGV